MTYSATLDMAEEFSKITMSVPSDLLEAFKAISKKQRRSVSSQFAFWIEEKLEEMEDDYDSQLLSNIDRSPSNQVSSEEFWSNVKEENQ